jgi:NAD(P)-dependent dehydrogenase (short-subunit alcohol dehydrogenase family)
MTNKVIFVVGAGPGLGIAVARKFGKAGYDVGLIARNEAKLAALGEALQAEGITTGWATADVSDSAELGAAVERLAAHTSRVDALHFNVSILREVPAADLTADQLLADLAAGTAALLTALQAARPYMSAGSVVLATGGGTADRPWAEAGTLGVQKAALRNLVTGIDVGLKADGIRASCVTVFGTMAEGTPFAPERVADVFLDLANRAGKAGDDWRPDVAFRG